MGHTNYYAEVAQKCRAKQVYRSRYVSVQNSMPGRQAENVKRERGIEKEKRKV